MKKKQPASERLLTVDEVAEYLNVDRFTVYRLLRQKKLPGFKVGNQWRFNHQMIEAWLMKNAKNARSEMPSRVRVRVHALPTFAAVNSQNKE